ncbi:MAG: hypothetical protein HYV09_13135 [Deltaproteobacteria bacterium]|nr:hypothetical protein [Deltaproteobacteria bacterium]
MRRAALSFAAVTVALSLEARAEPAPVPGGIGPDWFPVTGEVTGGGSFGEHSAGNVNVFLGYAHGIRFRGVENTGLLLAAGPAYTYRGFDPKAVGCRSASAYVDASDASDSKAATSSSSCGSGYSLGVHVRVGIAHRTDEDHHVPDHLVYVGATPLLKGTEPRLSLQDGRAHDLALRGLRVTLGWNFMALSRAVLKMDFSGKDDMANVLVLPLALLNKLELHYERATLAAGPADNRFGFATGFGF